MTILKMTDREISLRNAVAPIIQESGSVGVKFHGVVSFPEIAGWDCCCGVDEAPPKLVAACRAAFDFPSTLGSAIEESRYWRNLLEGRSAAVDGYWEAISAEVKLRISLVDDFVLTTPAQSLDDVALRIEWLDFDRYTKPEIAPRLLADLRALSEQPGTAE